jgi:DNA helicase HerA-like ATPase
MTSLIETVDVNPAPKVTGLGPCIGFVISTEESPSFYRMTFRVKPDCDVSPGQMVAALVDGPDGTSIAVVARVDDAHEVNPHEDALSSTLRQVLPFETKYAPEGESTVIFRAAEAETLEEGCFDAHGDLVEIRAIQTLAKAGAPVFEAGDDLVVSVLGTEPEPHDGFHVGVLRGSSTPFVLKKSIIQRHVFIGGGIGSGKSYTRGVLAEELHAFGVPQVNIDINGEMCEAAEELGGKNLLPGRDGFTLPLSALSSADVLEAVPSINPGTNMETLLRFTHETLLKEVVAGKRRFFTVDDLVNKIDECAQVLEMTVGADRRPDMRTVQPTKLRTQALNRLPFLGRPYDWEAVLTPGAFINVDCRGLLLGDLRLITASVARDLQSLARAERLPFVVLSIDEFHLVAPAEESAVTTQVLREIARIGRHFRLGLILTTQSPVDVDKSILKRLLTRFLHSIEPDQLQSLRGVFSDASEDLIRTLPKLPQGVCVVTGAFETVRHAAVVEVRRRRTTHGGGTPDIWSDFGRRGWPSKREAGGTGER